MDTTEKEIKCECKNIDWINYDKHKNNCQSCYCKYIREEISYETYENICILSKKNSGRKFKEICMVST